MAQYLVGAGRRSRLTRSSGRRLAVGRSAGARVVTAVAAVLLAISLAVRLGAPEGFAPQYGAWAMSLGMLAFSVVGVVILDRRVVRVGWLFCLTGLLHAIWDSAEVAGQVLTGPFGVVTDWIGGWVYVPAFLTPALALLRIPDDRLPAPRWRWVEVTAVSALAVATLAAMVGAADPSWESATLVAVGTAVGDGALPLTLMAGAVGLVVRYRRAGRTGRQQLKWLLVSVLLLLGVLGIATVLPASGLELPLVEAVLTGLSVALVPAGAGLAILRYGLFEVDLVINRTLVYGAISLGLGGLYVGAAALVGFSLGSDTGPVAAAFAAAVVALSLQPLRTRVQAGVDRLMFGERRNPYALLHRLGAQLEAAAISDRVLADAASTIGRALRVPSVRIEVREGDQDRPAATFGIPCGPELEIPLLRSERRVGLLAIGQRSPSEPFTRAERQLFVDLARQLGAAAHAAQLRHLLQRAHEDLVIAREEERRRIRRDLHDGLGSALAGVALHVRAARLTMTTDPPSGQLLLERASEQLAAAVEEIRRLVHDLRPPTLDELGLVPALQEQMLRIAVESPDLAPRIELDATDLEQLPAAIELAAYRICLEAVTNVVRHAHASNCTIALRLRDELHLVIDDDGIGIASGTAPGLGTSTLRERSQELGGSLQVGPSPMGGTRVHVTLPMVER